MIALGPVHRLVPRVFAELPPRWTEPRVTAWSRAQFGGRALGSFLEGPAFDADGTLHVVDIPNGRVFRFAPDGAAALVAEYDGWPNGLKVLASGQLLVADHRLGLVTVNPLTGRHAVEAEGYRGERFRGLNDLTIAPDGSVFVTDQGQSGLQEASGSVYRWDPGSTALARVMTGIPSPNGLVFARDGSLLVAVTRDNAVWRLPFVEDGGVSKVGVFLNLSGGGGPDGLALDAEGGLVVAQPGLGVLRFDTFGWLTHVVDAGPGARLSNVAFGGPGHGTLFITDSGRGRVLEVEMPVPGIPAAR